MKKILLLVSTIILSIHLDAQVTIGSAETPNPGALLDLKENAQGISKKGLGLPRVKLTSLTVTGNDLRTTIQNAANTGESWDINKHIGLMVYHVSGVTPGECAAIESGPYVWDGSQWELLLQNESPDVKTFKDTRPQTLGTQTYTYRNFGNAGDWMLENMRYIDNTFTYADPGNYDPSKKNYVYPNGDQATTQGTAPATWYNKQGLLYSFLAMLNGVDNQQDESGNNPDEPKAQGICPPGWHLPTDYEWSQLEEELALNPQKYSTVNTATPWIARKPNSDQDSGMDDYSTEDTRPAGSIGHATAMLSKCALAEGISTGGASLGTRQGGLNIMLTGLSVMGTFSSTEKFGEITAFHTASYSYKPDYIWFRAFFAGGSSVTRSKGELSILAAVRCKRDN